MRMKRLGPSPFGQGLLALHAQVIIIREMFWLKLKAYWWPWPEHILWRGKELSPSAPWSEANFVFTMNKQKPFSTPKAPFAHGMTLECVNVTGSPHFNVFRSLLFLTLSSNPQLNFSRNETAGFPWGLLGEGVIWVCRKLGFIPEWWVESQCREGKTLALLPATKTNKSAASTTMHEPDLGRSWYGCLALDDLKASGYAFLEFLDRVCVSPCTRLS